VAVRIKIRIQELLTEFLPAQDSGNCKSFAGSAALAKVNINFRDESRTPAKKSESNRPILITVPSQTAMIFANLI